MDVLEQRDPGDEDEIRYERFDGHEYDECDGHCVSPHPREEKHDPFRVVLPADTEFDEGKKGPWLKLTWDQAFELARLLETGQNEKNLAGVLGDLRAQLAARRNEEAYAERLDKRNS